MLHAMWLGEITVRHRQGGELLSLPPYQFARDSSSGLRFEVKTEIQEKMYICSIRVRLKKQER
jgi:hypothetical protein